MKVLGKRTRRMTRKTAPSHGSARRTWDAGVESATSAIDFITALSGAAFRVVRAAGIPLRFAQGLLLEPAQLNLLGPEQREMMRETGSYLRDMREVAGLTVADLGGALDLEEHSLLTAVESGTATLSFELILRLAGVLARHDPLPFIMRFVRTYNPEIEKVMEDWGVTRLPLQIERERHFVNIYRRHDEARKLSDRSFDAVLEFTRAAFEFALHFATEQETPRRRKSRPRSG